MDGIIKNTSRKVRKSLMRFLRNKRGATAIEFAMIMPFFLCMTGVVAEVAAMLFLEYALQGGVQEAARHVRTGQAQNSNMTSAKFKEKICTFVPYTATCKDKLQVYVNSASNFATLQTSIIAPGALGAPLVPGGPATTPPFVCGNAQQVVAVMATIDYKFFLGFMQPFGDVQGGKARRLVGYAIFRNEPFPATGSCGG